MGLSDKIRTERLELRPLAESDAEAVFGYASDPEVAKNTAWAPHDSIEDTLAYLRMVLEARSERDGEFKQVWAIRYGNERGAIGTIDLIQDTAGRAHVDFALSKEYWNRGFMTEAVVAVLSWGFERLSALEEVRSGGLSRNAGTMRVLEKVGFSLRGESCVPHPPKFLEPIEVSHFEITRAEFMKSVDRPGGAP